MPTKKGGGNKPQNYDPSNGRYSCKYDKSFSYLKAESQMLAYETNSIKNRLSKIMPNYKKSRTLDEKFTEYSLNKTHKYGKFKAIVYERVLGFTKENYLNLKNQIHRAIVEGKAFLKNISINDQKVIKYTYIINVKGANGHFANVVAVYGIAQKSGKPVLITNYVE